MLPYIDTETNQYPLYEPDIRLLYPGKSFKTPFVAPERYQIVYVKDTPIYDRLNDGYEAKAPELGEDGKWIQGWNVFPLEASQAAANVQAEKDAVHLLVDAEQARREAAQTVTVNGVVVGILPEDCARVERIAKMGELAGLETAEFHAKGGWVTLTLSDAQAIMVAQLQALQAIGVKARAHYDAINALSEAAAFDAYRKDSISAGWD